MKFKNPLTNVYRVVKLDTEQKFHAPGITEEDDWDCENTNFICVFAKVTAESKPLDDWAEAAERSEKVVTEPTVAQPKTVDLIILNLSPQTAEDELRGYFESKFGPLLMAEIKKDRKTNASRRFAFIRFKNYKDQMRALGQVKHKIDNQQVRLALPDYRDPQELYQENKCFIGRVNEAIKAADLREFFSQFGEIVEVSYPKKFKGYAFVTFSDVDVAQRVIGQDFVIKGFSVCVSKSTHGNANGNNNVNKGPVNMNQRFGGGGGGFQNDWNNGWYGRDAPWTPGSPYVTAPLNPQMERNNQNFYGHSAALSSMGNSLLNNNSHSHHVNPLNVLSMAMANLAMNQGSPMPMNAGNVRSFKIILSRFINQSSFPAKFPSRPSIVGATQQQHCLNRAQSQKE
jgi:RNA recognition motif-containing protein